MKRAANCVKALFQYPAILTLMRRVYAFFMCREGWHVQFLEPDLRTPIHKHLRFTAPAKIMELAERGGADLSLDSRAALEHGIQIGRGGFYLNLTDEQYRRLV